MQEESYEVVEDPTIEEVFASGSDEPGTGAEGT